jgi:hypothetical protein
MSENNWKPGDIAVCVKVGSIMHKGGNFPPLRLKAEYMVQNVKTCECGSISLDVGLYSEGGVSCSCDAKSSPHSGIWWCNAIRFVKKQTNKEVEEQIEEAVANENYELAQELTNKLKQ